MCKTTWCILPCALRRLDGSQSLTRWDRRVSSCAVSLGESWRGEGPALAPCTAATVGRPLSTRSLLRNAFQIRLT